MKRISWRSMKPVRPSARNSGNSGSRTISHAYARMRKLVQNGHDDEQEQQRLVRRVAGDVVGEREADDERRQRPDDRQLQRLEEDVAVEVEVADDVVPQVAVVVERPRVGDVREADDLAEARRRDEAERDEEEERRTRRQRAGRASLDSAGRPRKTGIRSRGFRSRDTLKRGRVAAAVVSTAIATTTP